MTTLTEDHGTAHMGRTANGHLTWKDSRLDLYDKHSNHSVCLHRRSRENILSIQTVTNTISLTLRNSSRHGLRHAFHFAIPTTLNGRAITSGCYNIMAMERVLCDRCQQATRPILQCSTPCGSPAGYSDFSLSLPLLCVKPTWVDMISWGCTKYASQPLHRGLKRAGRWTSVVIAATERRCSPDIVAVS